MEESADSLSFAAVLQELVDVQFPDAKKIVLVTDNASYHSPAALYKAFPPAEAFRIVQKIKNRVALHPGAWFLAERGKDRTLGASAPVSGPSHPRPGHPTP